MYHLYVVRVADSDGAIGSLGAQGIGTGIHYPVPLHLQKACAFLGYGPGDFPVSERIAAEMPSLVMYPQLSDAQQALIAGQLQKAASSAERC